MVARPRPGSAAIRPSAANGADRLVLQANDRHASQRSTSEQLLAAQKALTGRGLEWWRGIPTAWPAQPLRAGLKPLEVTWSKPSPEPSSPDKGQINGSSGDIPGLIAQFRANYPCRLVIKGTAGSGKSVLARMIMAELLRNPEAGDPVPVFLPLWSWSPRDERLHDSMKNGRSLRPTLNCRTERRTGQLQWLTWSIRAGSCPFSTGSTRCPREIARPSWPTGHSWRRTG